LFASRLIDNIFDNINNVTEKLSDDVTNQNSVMVRYSPPPEFVHVNRPFICDILCYYYYNGLILPLNNILCSRPFLPPNRLYQIYSGQNDITFNSIV